MERGDESAADFRVQSAQDNEEAAAVHALVNRLQISKSPQMPPLA